MYTQCPECSVAFRVTADVLKQAAGKVRCGGCGSAFNALEYLSEQKPSSAGQRSEPEPHVPELTPDNPDELEADTPPRSISAEQSAALLKTLDQLAGEDIRIEDTGVEWRVLGPDEVNENLLAYPDEDELGGGELAAAVGETSSLRFLLQDDGPNTDAAASDNAPRVIDARRDESVGADAASTETPEEASDELTGDEPDHAAENEQLRFDDNTPLPDDFDFGSAAVAEPDFPDESLDVSPEVDESRVDIELGNAAEWEDLLGEVADAETPQVETADTQTPEADTEPADMDTQFAEQAAAMNFETGGADAEWSDAIELQESQEPDADFPDNPEHPDLEANQFEESKDTGETSIEEDLYAAAFEAEEAARALAEDGDSTGETEIESVDDEPDGASGTEGFELSIPNDAGDLEADDLEADAADTDMASAAIDFPELSEEEKTLNFMIDQDLLAIAVQDEDGFASTIVQKQVSDVDDIPAEKERLKKAEPKAANNPLVETIVMEGDFVRSETEAERVAADREAGAAVRKFFAHSEDSDEPGFERSGKLGMVAGIVGLALLLGAQFVHQSRQTLATIPAVNTLIGPVYRALGRPVTPAWDIGGWRFEATKGNTDETDQRLSIYSRVGNTSDSALPLPLLHVSLTDRFEEIAGSRVLEPSEYLVEGANPRRTIAPGQSFNAVIPIESPPAAATGFKLNVCYRLAGGKLKCATEDFK